MLDRPRPATCRQKADDDQGHDDDGHDDPRDHASSLQVPTSGSTEGRRRTAPLRSGRGPGLANPGRGRGTRGCPNAEARRGAPPAVRSPWRVALAAEKRADACRVGDQLLLLVDADL